MHRRPRSKVSAFLPWLWSLAAVAVIVSLALLGGSLAKPTGPRVVVHPGAGPSDAAAAIVLDLFVPGGYNALAVDPESSDHVALAAVDGVRVDLYTYESNFDDRGQMRCAILVETTDQGGGSGGGCPDDAQTTPHILASTWSGSHHGQEAAVNTLALVWTPPQAHALVIDTADGRRIRANIVDGHSIGIWNGGNLREARVVTVVDKADEALWSQQLPIAPRPPAPS